MAEPNEKLARSLEVLRALQRSGRGVIRTSEISRTHRERLTRNGFLWQPLQGWLVPANPGDRDGDSTSWYLSFWEFCAAYCTWRFGAGWHLSAHVSTMIHAGDTAVPHKCIVMAATGSNNAIDLPYDTAIVDVRQAQPREDLIEVIDGLRVLTSFECLVRAPDSLYRTNAVALQVVLSQITEPSDILRHLLAGGHVRPAGRIAGGLRRIGRGEIADAIVSTMRAAEYDVRETDPFDVDQALLVARSEMPISARIRALWGAYRGDVMEIFPDAPGVPEDRSAYLDRIDGIYEFDAYHSLSIEGYAVSADLIERVRSGGWNPDISEDDRRNADALAARGYWQAFQKVRADVKRIVSGEAPGPVVQASHQDWYRELFQPYVSAGIVKAVQLAGYRDGPVYLRGSRHVPPNREGVRAAMSTLFELLAAEESAAVRSVLGHWMMGYIHPFPDGNGRTARFMMNSMLASGGYPWTVVETGARGDYLAALEAASVDGDIKPFASFLAKRVIAAGSGGAAP